MNSVKIIDTCVIIISLGILGCAKPEFNLTICEERFVGTWHVKEHFIAFVNDTLRSEYTSQFDLKFNEDSKGVFYFEHNYIQDFKWMCDSDTINIDRINEASAFGYEGNYKIQEGQRDTVILEDHRIYQGISIHGFEHDDERRTWKLFK